MGEGVGAGVGDGVGAGVGDGVGVAGPVRTADLIDMWLIHVCGNNRTHDACTDAENTPPTTVVPSKLAGNTRPLSTSLYEEQS